MTSDDYRPIDVTFRHMTGKAFFADRLAGPGQVSIPLSLIHVADERLLSGLFAGEKATIRLRAWKAEELGFPRSKNTPGRWIHTEPEA